MARDNRQCTTPALSPFHTRPHTLPKPPPPPPPPVGSFPPPSALPPFLSSPPPSSSPYSLASPPGPYCSGPASFPAPATPQDRPEPDGSEYGWAWLRQPSPSSFAAAFVTAPPSLFFSSFHPSSSLSPFSFPMAGSDGLTESFASGEERPLSCPLDRSFPPLASYPPSFLPFSPPFPVGQPSLRPPPPLDWISGDPLFSPDISATSSLSGALLPGPLAPSFGSHSQIFYPALSPSHLSSGPNSDVHTSPATAIATAAATVADTATSAPAASASLLPFGFPLALPPSLAPSVPDSMSVPHPDHGIGLALDAYLAEAEAEDGPIFPLHSQASLPPLPPPPPPPLVAGPGLTDLTTAIPEITLPTHIHHPPPPLTSFRNDLVTGPSTPDDRVPDAVPTATIGGLPASHTRAAPPAPVIAPPLTKVDKTLPHEKLLRKLLALPEFQSRNFLLADSPGPFALLHSSLPHPTGPEPPHPPPSHNPSKMRIHVQLSANNLENIPDSFRLRNALFPRSWFPAEIQGGREKGVQGRWADYDDGDDQERHVSSAALDSDGFSAHNHRNPPVEEIQIPLRPLNCLSSSTSNNNDILATTPEVLRFRVPRMRASKRQQELLINDLSALLVWAQSRALDERTLLVQQVLDSWRKMLFANLKRAERDLVRQIEVEVAKVRVAANRAGKGGAAAAGSSMAAAGAAATTTSSSSPASHSTSFSSDQALQDEITRLRSLAADYNQAARAVEVRPGKRKWLERFGPADADTGTSVTPRGGTSAPASATPGVEKIGRGDTRTISAAATAKTTTKPGVAIDPDNGAPRSLKRKRKGPVESPVVKGDGSTSASAAKASLDGDTPGRSTKRSRGSG